MSWLSKLKNYFSWHLKWLKGACDERFQSWSLYFFLWKNKTSHISLSFILFFIILTYIFHSLKSCGMQGTVYIACANFMNQFQSKIRSKQNINWNIIANIKEFTHKIINTFHHITPMNNFQFYQLSRKRKLRRKLLTKT